MLAWIWRLLLLLAVLVTALFVSQDALTFGVIDALVAVLIIGFAIVAAGSTFVARRAIRSDFGRRIGTHSSFAGLPIPEQSPQWIILTYKRLPSGDTAPHSDWRPKGVITS